METTNTKKHADFQSSYRRSSNFNRTLPKEDFKIKGDGKVKLDTKKRLDEYTTSEKQDMVDRMDRFQQRIEQIPGGDQEN